VIAPTEATVKAALEGYAEVVRAVNSAPDVGSDVARWEYEGGGGGWKAVE
jgi:hypothetical protein